MRREREHDRWRVAFGRFLEGLRTDQHTNVQQNGRNGDNWDERHHHMRAARRSADCDTQPKIPPCALIICKPIS